MTTGIEATICFCKQKDSLVTLYGPLAPPRPICSWSLKGKYSSDHPSGMHDRIPCTESFQISMKEAITAGQRDEARGNQVKMFNNSREEFT